MNNAIPPKIAALDKQVYEQTLPQISQYYNETLLASRSAIQFVKKQLSCQEPNFELLGYADRTLGNYLPSPSSKEGQLLRGSLKRLGILRISGHERLCGCAIVLYRKDTQVLAMYGERIGLCQSYELKRQWLIFGKDLTEVELPRDFNHAYKLSLQMASEVPHG